MYIGCAQMTLAALLFSCMGLAIRFISEDIGEVQIIFIRNMIILTMFAPALLTGGVRPGLLEHRYLYLLRGAVSVAGMYGFFASIRALELPLVVALTFTVPLMTAALAALFLGEKVGPRRWAGMAAGLLGAVVIIRPFGGSVSLPMVIMLATAFTWAVSGVLVKAMTEKRGPEDITCGMCITMVPFCLILLPFCEWRPLSGQDWLLIAFLGFCALEAQICVAASFARADVSAVLPFDFFRLVFAGILAYIFLGEVMDIYTLAGALIIAAAAIYVAKRESAAKKREETTPR